MKVMFPVTIILLCVWEASHCLGGRLICLHVPPRPTAATNCKYGLDYGNILPKRPIGGCPSCGPSFIPCAKKKLGPPNTFPSQGTLSPFDEQYDGARGADTVSLHDSNVHVPLHLAAAVLKLNLKVGTSVTGIPLSKFRKFMNFALYVETSHQINVGFDAKSETHVGLGVATVNDKCNNKMQIVVIAKRSSNSQKLKAALERQLKSKMDPLKGCSRSLRGY